MPRFVYDRERARDEYRRAKEELREYYLWRYGYKPPATWTVDHQVEKSIYLYERYGPAHIHGLNNMLIVPPEVNIGKNVLYGQPWSALASNNITARIRKLVPRTVQIAQFNRCSDGALSLELAPIGASVEVSPSNETGAKSKAHRPLAIREILYLYSHFAPDHLLWSVLEELSTNSIRQIELDLWQTRWKNEPPEWHKRYPRWRDRFLQELDTHSEGVSDYIRYKRNL